MTRSGSKRNEKVWQVVRGCAGEGATEFQRVFRPLSSPRINHPWQRLSMSPPLLSSNSQLYVIRRIKARTKIATLFSFLSPFFLPPGKRKKFPTIKLQILPFTSSAIAYFSITRAHFKLTG